MPAAKNKLFYHALLMLTLSTGNIQTTQEAQGASLGTDPARPPSAAPNCVPLQACFGPRPSLPAFDESEVVIEEEDVVAVMTDERLSEIMALNDPGGQTTLIHAFKPTFTNIDELIRNATIVARNIALDRTTRAEAMSYFQPYQQALEELYANPRILSFRIDALRQLILTCSFFERQQSTVRKGSSEYRHFAALILQLKRLISFLSTELHELLTLILETNPPGTSAIVDELNATITELCDQSKHLLEDRSPPRSSLTDLSLSSEATEPPAKST